MFHPEIIDAPMLQNLVFPSLQASSALPSSFTCHSSQNYSLTRPWSLQKKAMTQVSCLSTRREKKTGYKGEKSEAEELVYLLTRNMNGKEPLLKTLNKYVRIARYMDPRSTYQLKPTSLIRP
ncbi:hypothetical protein CJ030_MR6G007165 [Morella rubra]|uniref:Uncharacterized protein n=1 Tax=Morella rubra TaxID=262757 RepID=A0A6A1VCE0_9ROSI|nr:hypothetical protein CJ030_MR6G007165 [Morella rubra]